MSLIELLVEGHAGIRLQLPSKFKVLVDRETFACWLDGELGVRVIAMHSHDPLDLRDARKPTLAGDLKAGARRMFADMYRALAAESEPTSPARTDDPDWSPLVEFAVIERDDGRILRCVQRLALQPGREMVRGLLLIPTAHGHISLSAIHDAHQTGYRESALLMSGLLEAASNNSENFSGVHVDDPAHDQQFPDHGLTRVRACLAHWLDPEAGLAITPEPIRFPEGEIRVEFGTGSGSVVLPVGFMPQFPGPSVKSGGIKTLVRVGIDEAPEAKLTVSAVPNEDSRIASAAELVAAARASVESWAERGASDIEITTEHVTPTWYRAQVCVYASLRMDGKTHLLVAHWILTDRNAVFRFELWTRPPHQFGGWAPLVEEAVQTWQR